jgi:hypothetical protein
MVISYGGTPLVTVNVSELGVPKHASPVPVRVAAVGVEPTVTVIGVPRLAGRQLLRSVTAVIEYVVVAFSTGVVIGVPLT